VWQITEILSKVLRVRLNCLTSFYYLRRLVASNNGTLMNDDHVRNQLPLLITLTK
jgi:hypothetical protein